MFDDLPELEFDDPPAFDHAPDSGLEAAALFSTFMAATTEPNNGLVDATLYGISTTIPAKLPLAGMAVCLTGECYGVGGKDYIKGELTKLGAVIKSGVTKKCTHLLVGTEPGPVKQRKARELKLTFLTEDWLEKTFKENGVTCHGEADLDWMMADL